MPSRYSWGATYPAIEQLQEETRLAREAILTHPVYHRLATKSDIALFMSHHVFAVWDFMSLLKTLQRTLTCVDVPWVPTGDRACRRLINEIVLVEESDEYGDSYLSHFELYLRAMEQVGADVSPIESFLAELARGSEVPAALSGAGAPAPAAEFVRSTWAFVKSAPPHALAAVFAFGREDLIPDMFSRLLLDGGTDFDVFRDYLSRHIAVDGEYHTPMAMEMLVTLCDSSPQRWQECVAAVKACLLARAALWDGINAALLPERNSHVR